MTLSRTEGHHGAFGTAGLPDHIRRPQDDPLRSSRAPEVELRAKLRDLANERRRFGYRRLFILLRRDGEPSGVNRIYRLYREEGLSVRKRKARRRAVGARAPILVEAKANARWSLDFVHDQFACGRRFRILNVVDDATRECSAAIPDTSISGRRVARERTTLVSTARRADRLRPRPPFEPCAERCALMCVYRWTAPAEPCRWPPSSRKCGARCDGVLSDDIGCRPPLQDRIRPGHRAIGSRSSGRGVCRR